MDINHNCFKIITRLHYVASSQQANQPLIKSISLICITRTVDNVIGNITALT